MAIIAVFLGGFVGFIAGIISFVGYDASLLNAFSIYMVTGFVFSTGAILNSMIQSKPAPVKAMMEA